MPASGDRNAPIPPSNLTFLHQRHRSRLQGSDNFNLRPVPPNSHESNKRDNYAADRFRIYPKELTKNKASKLRTKSQNAVTSPLLSALGTTTNTAAQYTSDWARSLPFFPANQQPGHSSSPPTHMSSRDAPGVPSTSPPGARPQSHPNQYQSFGGSQRPTQQQRDRRPSFYSQLGQSPYNHVPRPHEDQAHFYAGGLPDLDSLIPNMLPPSGLSPGERGFYVGFDSLSTSGHGPSISAENVLLIGEEGSLRIYKVTKKNIDIIGRLDGLRGSVTGAKILPWTSHLESGANDRPYVALIVHAPILTAEETAGSSNTSDAQSLEGTDTSPDSMPRIMGEPMDIRDVVRHYQTTVEVYSLSSRRHVATVFKSNPVEMDYSSNREPKPPSPIGDLKIDANGKFLVVASGTSGEVYIFAPSRTISDEDTFDIHCIGKLWTSVQRRDVKQSNTTTPSEGPPTLEQDQIRHIPLFSLSQRWIAVVPPTTDSLFSSKGTPLTSSRNTRPPGIGSHAPPPKPNVTCGVDTPENEGVMDKLSREVTQRVIKGTQWITEQGSQAWNSYWNRPQAGIPTTGGLYVPEMAPQAFPPTHGHGQAPSSTPTQVAIFDLQKLSDAEEVRVKNALVPIATFEPPSGCSYLSFAPNGLVLITVSKKGDQQFVWSLMRMQHPRSGLTYDHHTPPYVRQIARFTRMTIASVVDIVWNCPLGTRFALLTERGTIHVHEIPAIAFQWPPLRRARRQKEPPKSEHANHLDGSSGSKGAISTAMDTINGTGAWLRQVSQRPRSMGNGTSFPTTLMMTPAATANVGGKVVKAGLSKGVSMVANSANTIYHASENKLHIGNLTNGISPGCMHWMLGRDRGYCAVVVTGTLSIYHVRQTSTPQKGKPPLIRAKLSKKPIEYTLHKISDAVYAPAFIAAIEARQQGNTKLEILEPAGFWHLRSPTSHNVAKSRPPVNWHPLFETETNPPCQPFHTDRRITLSTVTKSSPPTFQAPTDLHESSDEEDPNRSIQITTPSSNTHSKPWVFGLPIPTTTILSGHELFGDDDVENKIQVIEGIAGEQVVVTTVRRTGKEEEEFFEDGCEVVDFADDRI